MQPLHGHVAPELLVTSAPDFGTPADGEALEKHVTAGAGDFVFIPAGVPHVAANYGGTDAVALMARSDPQALESVEIFPELDRLAHILSPPRRMPGRPRRIPRGPF